MSSDSKGILYRPLFEVVPLKQVSKKPKKAKNDWVDRLYY